MYHKFALVALCIAGVARAMPTKREVGQVVTASVAFQPETFDEQAGGAASPYYTVYAGDGLDGWPTQDQWASFASLWDTNAAIMQQCDSPANTQQNIDDIRAAIIKYAGSSKVDPRFILAIVMQESSGCVFVQQTDLHGTQNPGLMQSHHGPGTCEGQGTCSADRIDQMINDGTQGTAEGDGLAGLINQAQDHYAGDASARLFYAAARLYYTGNGAPVWADLNQSNGHHNCYSMDIANRLTGWAWSDPADPKCVSDDPNDP